MALAGVRCSRSRKRSQHCSLRRQTRQPVQRRLPRERAKRREAGWAKCAALAMALVWRPRRENAHAEVPTIRMARIPLAHRCLMRRLCRWRSPRARRPRRRMRHQMVRIPLAHRRLQRWPCGWHSPRTRRPRRSMRHQAQIHCLAQAPGATMMQDSWRRLKTGYGDQ